MQSQDYQDTPVFTDTVHITEDNEVIQFLESSLPLL